jgi:hypothetical protein
MKKQHAQTEPTLTIYMPKRTGEVVKGKFLGYFKKGDTLFIRLDGNLLSSRSIISAIKRNASYFVPNTTLSVEIKKVYEIGKGKKSIQYSCDVYAEIGKEKILLNPTFVPSQDRPIEPASEEEVLRKIMEVKQRKRRKSNEK